MQRLALISALLLVMPGATSAHDIGAAHETSPAFAQNYLKLRDQDRMVQRVGWRLASANAQFCKDTVYRTGLQIDDASAYRNAAAVRSINGLVGDIFVQSIVPSSPAAKAGLTEGQEIAAIAAEPVAQTLFDPEQPWVRSILLREKISAHLNDADTLPITTGSSNTPVVITAVKLCASSFEVVTGRDDAVANGQRVAIGRGFDGFDYPEDEFAAALAHELAHNLLGHAKWLKENGRKRRNIRETEREADRLMPWLLANAGYDPVAAARFMRKAKPGHGGGLFRSRSHDAWDERAVAIENEVTLVKGSQAKHGHANWKSDFSPQFVRD